jgi:hypothetical protein
MCCVRRRKWTRVIEDDEKNIQQINTINDDDNNKGIIQKIFENIFDNKFTCKYCNREFITNKGKTYHENFYCKSKYHAHDKK